MEKETVHENNVYVELIKKMGYSNPHSKYLLRILQKMASVEDAKLMLALPAEPAVLSQKTGLSEEEVGHRLKTLAEKGMVQQRIAAQQSLVDAMTVVYRLSEKRYEKGIDSYLSVLDAQRSLYGAQQGLILLRLAYVNNLVTLYKTLGGGATP